MTYIPPICNKVWLKFNEDYELPSACDVPFVIGDPQDEQSYTPPPCSQVWFEFITPYLIPNGCNVAFQIGPRVTVSYVEITPHDIEIKTDMETVRTFSGTMMLPHNVEIVTDLESSKLDLVWEFNLADMEVLIEIDNRKIEILPDIQIKNIEIVTNMDGMSAKGVTDADLPRGTGSGIKVIGWDNGSDADHLHTNPWDTPTSIHINPTLRSVFGERQEKEIIVPWTSLNKKDIAVNVSASEFVEKINHTVVNPWKTMYFLDVTNIVHGNSLKDIDLFYYSRHNTGIPTDKHKTVTWGTGKERTLSFITPWNAPKANDSHQKSGWGPFSYFSLCTDDYSPAPGCDVYFEFPNKYDLIPGACKDLQFNVNSYMSREPRCQYNHNHSGIRDSYVWVDPSNQFLTYPKDLGVYHMLNTILVEEVITGDPIEILHVEAGIDMSSWLWSFSVTVSSKCFLDKIKPVDGILGNIKITMNGWDFLCTVESWTENRSWGSDAWTVTGRSPSMLFGSPVAEAKSNTISSGKQGQTIFEDYMAGRTYPLGWPYTLWEANFEKYLTTTLNPSPTSTGFRPYENWYLPENTVSYSDKTDIDFLKELADSIGAYIQTEPTTNALGKGQLTIIPRYAHQPWTWNLDNTGISWRVLNESQCIEVSRSNSVKIEYHAVNIIGESLKADGTSGTGDNAMHVNVIRNGYGTSAKYASMITSPYITTSKAALEKGRMTIGNSGEWVKHTFRVGMLCEDAGSSTAMFRPGEMISIIERGTPIYGQITGVKIAAVSAGTGFAIEQTIEVEEYVGD